MLETRQENRRVLHLSIKFKKLIENQLKIVEISINDNV